MTMLKQCRICGNYENLMLMNENVCVICLSKKRIKDERRLALETSLFEEMMQENASKPVRCMNSNCNAESTLKEAHEAHWCQTQGIMLCDKCAQKSNYNNVWVHVEEF